LTNKRIVSIVDDDLNIAELFYEPLRGITGISVFRFNNPLIALKHFANNKDDYVLVISDLRMPELNGLELLNKMKKLNGFLRTILMSAYEVQNDKIFLQDAKKGIIDKFFKKPISITALRKEVNNQIHAYELSPNFTD
jgi:DNA-binding NtrC family response regulator